MATSGWDCLDADCLDADERYRTMGLTTFKTCIGLYSDTVDEIMLYYQ